MVDIRHRSEIAAPTAICFGYLSDLRNAAQWLFGVSKLEVVGEQSLGLGTIYDGSIKLGPKTLHSTIEVAAWEAGRLITIESIAGFVNRSTWRLIPLGDDRTELCADITYELPGGLAGRALGKVIEPFVQIAIGRSDAELGRRVRALHEAKF